MYIWVYLPLPTCDDFHNPTFETSAYEIMIWICFCRHGREHEMDLRRTSQFTIAATVPAGIFVYKLNMWELENSINID